MLYVCSWNSWYGILSQKKSLQSLQISFFLWIKESAAFPNNGGQRCLVTMHGRMQMSSKKQGSSLTIQSKPKIPETHVNRQWKKKGRMCGDSIGRFPLAGSLRREKAARTVMHLHEAISAFPASLREGSGKSGKGNITSPRPKGSKEAISAFHVQAVLPARPAWLAIPVSPAVTSPAPQHTHTPRRICLRSPFQLIIRQAS
jgi:hypothetical protein